MRCGIRNDLELEWRRNIGDWAVGSAREPRVVTTLTRNDSSVERVIVHMQRDGVREAAKPNASEHRRRTTGNFDDGSLRDTCELTDRQRFRLTSEVGRIRRTH